MTPEKRNPVTLAADRASKAFCLAAERSEDSPLPPRHQGSFDAQDDLAWSPTDWRLANGGSSECEMALLDSTPIASDPRMHASLWALGIREMAALYAEPVVFLPNNCFEFARDARDASGAVVAVVFHAPDDLGNPLDLAAWEPKSGRLALWLGRVSMLGQDNLYAWRLGEPLVAHETALEWLQAGRAGVFVIDPQRASLLLRMVEPLGVKRPTFGRQLQTALTIRAPRIVVAAQRRAT
jgi:hypothetical protein